MMRSVVLLAVVTAAIAYKYAIPFYRYPDAQWDLITGLDSVQLVIFNPASGPGDAVNQDYVERIAALKAAGQLVGGYTYSLYGQRPISDVKADIDKFFDWYPQIDGIFVDEAQSDADGTNAAGQNFLEYYREIKSYIRAKGARKGIVLNHGTIPDEAYVAMADIDCIFEGPYSDYVNFESRVPSWVFDYPPDKFWHIVHDTPYANNVDVVRIARATNAHFVYMTDLTGANPYNSLPTWAKVKPTASSRIKYGQLAIFNPCCSADWNRFSSVFDLASTSAAPTDAVLGFTVISPSSGPGTAVDPNYVIEINQMHTHGGLVFGYIATDNGARSAADIKSQIDGYYNLYDVDGFYFDQTFGGMASYWAELTSYAKTTSTKPSGGPGLTLMAFGAGASNKQIADSVDIVTLFAGDATSFLSYEAPSWVAGQPSSRFNYLVANAQQSQLDALLGVARANNAGYLSITDADSIWSAPFVTPSYLEIEVAKLLAITGPVAQSTSGAPSVPPPVTTGASVPPADDRVELGVFQGFYPAGGAYDAFSSALSLASNAPAASDAVIGFTIISPNSGPYPGNPDSDIPAYVAEIGRIHAHGGRVLGYIALGNVAKPLADVRAEIDEYYSKFGVDGFYLDQTYNADPVAAAGIIGQIKSYAISSSAKPAAAPGTIALAVGYDGNSADFAAVADILQVYNGDATGFLSLTRPAWAAPLPAERLYALVSSADAAQIDSIIAVAQTQRIGYLYATDSVWGVSPYFSTFVDKLVESSA